jgi:gas vesicle protein
MSFIQYLIGGVIGVGVAKLFSDDNKNKSSEKNNYSVYVKSDDFDKSNMRFYSFDEAKEMYDKIVKSKKVKYKEIIANDEAEKKIYDKWLEEGKIGKEGYPKLSDDSSIQSVFLIINDEEVSSFEKK